MAKATCILDRDAMREDRGGHDSSRASKTSGHEEEGEMERRACCSARRAKCSGLCALRTHAPSSAGA